MHSNIWKILYKNDAFIQIKTTTNFYWIGMVVAGMLSIQTADLKKKTNRFEQICAMLITLNTNILVQWQITPSCLHNNQ